MLITAEYDPIEEREALREEAWEYGHEEGHAAGRAEEKLEIARKMKEAGRPFSEIAEFTDLPPETVREL